MTQTYTPKKDYATPLLLGLLTFLIVVISIFDHQSNKQADRWNTQCINMIYETDLPQDVKDVMVQGVFKGNSDLRSQIWSVAYAHQPKPHAN